jgi:hypothetical protein
MEFLLILVATCDRTMLVLLPLLLPLPSGVVVDSYIDDFLIVDVDNSPLFSILLK